MRDNGLTKIMFMNEENKLNLGSVTKRTFKCLGCKHYGVEVVNDKGGIAKVCKIKENDTRVIVNLDAPNCTNYEYGW